MDGRVLYSPLPHSSLGQAIWTRLKLGSFYNTISFPLIHGSSKGTWPYFLNAHIYCQRLYVPRVIILLVTSCVDTFFEEYATCHLLVGCVVSSA